MTKYIFAVLYIWCGLILNEGSGPNNLGWATQAAAVMVLPAFAAIKLMTGEKI